VRVVIVSLFLRCSMRVICSPMSPVFLGFTHSFVRSFHFDDVRFWRGTVIFKPKCVDNWGNFARLQALSLAVQAPDLVDVGCVAMHGHDLRRSCVFGVDPHSCDGEPRPPATWRRPKEDSLTKAVRKFVPVHDFAKRRVLLNLPGAKSGSYSRNLNVLWMMKSVVLLWNGPFVEWYVVPFFLSVCLSFAASSTQASKQHTDRWSVPPSIPRMQVLPGSGPRRDPSRGRRRVPPRDGRADSEGPP